MRRLLLLALLINLVTVTLADAQLKIRGRGDKIHFDPESIPANFKPSYEIMNKKCVKCHSMEYTVVSIQSGRAVVTGQPFDKQAVKAYGIKMLRKSTSDMNRHEIKDVAMLLNYLIDECKR